MLRDLSMIDNKVKELTRKIETESKKLDKKIKDIEKIKSSITKDLKKNVKELKTNQLKKLQEEKKNITDKVKEMKSNLLNAKKEITTGKVEKKIEEKKQNIENNKKPIDKTAKKIMNAAALYNKNANKELINILENIKDSKKENDSDLKSINEIFMHTIQCDMHFFKVYRKYSSKKKIENEYILNYINEDFTFNENIDKDLNSLIDIRMKLDDIIIAVINSIEDFNIAGKIIIYNKEIKKPRYNLIMYAFNHSTHYRGVISVMLNKMGIISDFSNLIKMI